jgi:NADPH:quinone reductase-like Zn-dependent oxidoreductase
VVDYTKTDFTQSGQSYDVVVDAVGKISKARCGVCLADGGRFVTVKSPTKERIDELEYVQKLIAAGEVKVVIDKEYPLEHAIEAHRYVESGRKRGNVIIRV